MNKILLTIFLTVLVFTGCQLGEGVLTVRVERILAANSDNNNLRAGNEGAYIVYIDDEIPAEDLEAARSLLLSDEDVNTDAEGDVDELVLDEEDDSNDMKPWFFKVYNSDGELVGKGDIDPLQPIFAYVFDYADTFTIEVWASDKYNFGRSTLEQKVTADIVSYEWSLLSDNSKVDFMAGGNILDDMGVVLGNDPCVLDIRSILEEVGNVKSIDFRLVRADNQETFYFQRNVQDLITIASSVNDHGNYQAIITLNYYDGNRSFVEDTVVFKDPYNPVAMILRPSQNDPLYPNKIHFEASIDSPREIQQIKLIRTTYAGREDGCFPFAQPEVDGTIEYTKVGKPLYSASQELIVPVVTLFEEAAGMELAYVSSEGMLYYDDPMPYYSFNNEGVATQVEATDSVWTYAKFEREAWKSILRKEEFDINKVMNIEYKVVVTTDKGDVESLSVKGYPYLDRIAMSHFCLWVKEVAMNRIWHLQVPRYAYSKTRDWLTEGQNFQGSRSGRVWYNAGTSGGSGGIDNYSDFKDISVRTNRDLGISSPSIFDSNVSQNYFLDYTVTTSLYDNVVFVIDNIKVRDYTLQWGYWLSDNASEQGSGRFILTRDGETEIISAAEIKTIMPCYRGWGVRAGYGFEEWDWTNGPELGVSGEDHKSTWSRINFKYPPTPGDSENGVWKNKESNWYMQYEVN